MSDKRFIVAFEIGSSKIKGAVGEVDHTGTLSVISIEEEPLTDAVRYGCIRKVQDVSDCIQSITSKLNRHPAISPGTITGIYVSLGGQSLMSKATEVDRQFEEDTEITSKIIEQLKEQARREGVPDRDVVAVLTRDFTVDTLPQRNPIGVFCHRITAGLTVIYCRPQLKGNLKRVFSEKLPLNINGHIVRPLAIAGITLTEDEKHLGCMLVDFGAETTTVSIYRGGTLRYLATIPMGSRNITRDLTALNCLEKRAEELKKAVGNVSPNRTTDNSAIFEGLDNTEVNNYIQARTGEIITNIMEQPVYAGIKPEELPGGIIVTGGGSRLRGFEEMLANHSKMKVRRAVAMGPISYTQQSQNSPDNVDVLALLSIAARLTSKPCVEMPIPAEQPPAEDVDDGISRVGMDMDDHDPYRKGKSGKAEKKASFFERLGVRVMGILKDEDEDHFDDSDDESNK